MTRHDPLRHDPLRHDPLRHVPRSGPGLALLSVATAIVLVATWPERSEVANASWYPVAVVRVAGLALWGWLAGSASVGVRPAERRSELARLLIASVATAPLEALAFVATVPDASLAWSLSVPAPLALATYGIAWGIAAALRRARLGWLLPLASPAAAAGLLYLDLRFGAPLLMPWLLPTSASPAAAAVLVAGAAATAWFAGTAGRRGTRSP